MTALILVSILLSAISILLTLRGYTPQGCLLSFFSNVLLTAAWVADHSWPLVAFQSTMSALALLMWWITRRKGRKRSPRAYGAKSRALIAGLVRKAREVAQPRPVLRPIPKGA